MPQDLMNNVKRFASFSSDGKGGNPAGVLLTEQLPDDAVMQQIAKDVGFSETAFAAPQGNAWRVRYFAPAFEVAFCGHATIALGAALAETHGNGEYPLILNDAEISVEGAVSDDRRHAALMSPKTHTRPLDKSILNDALQLFGLNEADLDPDLPPIIANAGNDHLILPLRDRNSLAQMSYDLEIGGAFMKTHNFITINLIHFETPRRIHSRNAFAIGGVFEDPATGSAAAALSGYLREINWPHEGALEIIQGEDMGAKSVVHTDIGDEPSSSIRVYGDVRKINP